jgi:Ca2+-binding RTX toxin-like protein
MALRFTRIGTVVDDVMEGWSLDDLFLGSAGADKMIGNGGNDTVSYDSSTEAVFVDLKSDSQTGGDAEGDVLVDIDNVTGSKFGDVLAGNGAANILEGRDGDDRFIGRIDLALDILDGGAGNDTVDYASAERGLSILLGEGGAHGFTTFHEDGPGRTPLFVFEDELISIENVIGTKFGDVITGNSADNQLTGNAGNDAISGGAGNDTIFEGTDGALDTIDGGAGIDTVDYGLAGRGLSIFIGDGGGRGTAVLREAGAGAAPLFVFESDLFNIENVNGSAFGDSITGNNAGNVLRGGAGNDSLTGAGGADDLFGGAGNDTFIYASRTDSRGSATTDINISRDEIFDFESGRDRIDLSRLDFDTSNQTDDAFHISGTFSTFDGSKGAVAIAQNLILGQPRFTVAADFNGDRFADFAVSVVSANGLLLASDIIL